MCYETGEREKSLDGCHSITMVTSESVLKEEYQSITTGKLTNRECVKREER